MEKTLHSIKYEGNLYKRGRGKKLSFVKPWSVRRFVLDTSSGELTYFKDTDGKLLKKGSLSLAKASAVKVTKEESGKDYSFRVSVNGEDLYLACSNDKDIEMWIDAINYCANREALSPRRRKDKIPDRSFFLDDSVHDKSDPAAVDYSEARLEDVELGNENEACERDECNDTEKQSTEKNLRPLSVSVISTDESEFELPIFNKTEEQLSEELLSFSNMKPGNDNTCESDDGESPEDDAADQFPPLEKKFQDILVSYSDFVIDIDRGACGKGAFGTVYRAKRRSDNKEFALKFFGYAKRDPEQLDILGTEVSVMLKLKGSKFSPQIEGFFYDSYEGLLPNKKFINAFPVIAMEFVENDILTFLANSSANVIATTLPKVFRGIIEGLQFLHERGYIHRDLKVDNVMISADRNVKLIDFGFMAAVEEGQSDMKGQQVGTIGYFAPESIPLSGYSVYSAKSDIWQAGVVLYTLVSGKMPFNISSFNIRKGKYPPLVCPPWESRPEAVKDLVSHMLELDVSKRYSSEDILAHEWLAVDAPNTNLPDTSSSEYLKAINNLIQRRHIKKMLQQIQDDTEGEFDRSFKAESILEAVEITGGNSYFMIRIGALKSLLLQNISEKFKMYDDLDFTTFSQLVAKNELIELANVEIFSRFCNEHGFFNQDVAVTPSTLTIKELLLTLIAMAGTPEQSEDALACFLHFDLSCKGFLEKSAMLDIFRGMLEDEAMLVATGGFGSPKEVDSELDGIENEMKEIEEVFSCLETKDERDGIGFGEFKTFYDSVMKISTRVSTRLSMRSMSIVSLAVGKFTDNLHSIRHRKEKQGLASTARNNKALHTKQRSNSKMDLSKTM